MKTPPPELMRRLDKFPHIVYRVEETWGTAGGRAYLISLTDQGGRPQPRQGFPFEIFQVIHQLIQEHDRQFPHWVSRRKDIPWSK